MEATNKIYYKRLEETIREISHTDVPESRKEVLQPLIEFVREKVSGREQVRLNFICTHNSRRSHLSQVWAQTMAAYFTIPKVYCYSGGTEATAVFPMVLETLQDLGYHVGKLGGSDNLVYSIKYGPNEVPIIGFSKTFDHPFNPETGFAAIMTCSQADEGCPFVAGAEKRVPVTYDDPKAFDGSSQQTEKYRERSLQIASEMFYVFSQIKTS